jgi:cytochrome c biogenesis protein ResB
MKWLIASTLVLVVEVIYTILFILIYGGPLWGRTWYLLISAALAVVIIGCMMPLVPRITQSMRLRSRLYPATREHIRLH